MSTSMTPADAVTVEGSASDAARRMPALAVAFNSVGCAAPRFGALFGVVARRVAPGRCESATECLTTAGAVGASAGPSGICWVELVRRADPEAIMAGLSAAGNARSKFGDCPTPADPARDRVNAVRAGSASLSSPVWLCATDCGACTWRVV